MTASSHHRERGVFFDLDGTLSDYVGSARHALDIVWKGVGDRLPLHSKEEFLECYWRVFEEVEALARRGEITTLELGGRAPRFARVLDKLGVGGDEQILDDMADLYTKGRLEGAKLFPGAAETLAELSRLYVVTLITEGSGANQRAQIDRLGIGGYLDHIVISHEVGLHKPDPALHQYALAATGLAPNETLMVADRIDWDLIPASHAGMRTILFTENNIYMRLLEETGFKPDWTARNFAELREILLPGVP